MAAIPMVQLIVNIVTAIGFRVIMASIMSGCSMEKSHVMDRNGNEGDKYYFLRFVQ